MSTDRHDGGSTHILLEVSKTPEVFPPRCPHPGPGLDLREETLLSEPQAETYSQALINAANSRATGGDRVKSVLRTPQEKGTAQTKVTLIIASRFALKYRSRSW